MGSSRARVKSSTDQLHNLAVQGPNSRDILRPLVWTPPSQPKLEELTWFRFTIGQLMGLIAVSALFLAAAIFSSMGQQIYVL